MLLKHVMIVFSIVYFILAFFFNFKCRPIGPAKETVTEVETNYNNCQGCLQRSPFNAKFSNIQGALAVV